MPRSYHCNEPPRTCVRCGVQYTPRSTNQRYCSITCRDGERQPPSMRACPQCGTLFLPRVDTQRYCTSGCRTQFIAAGKPRLPEVLCAHCGKTFAPRLASQRYCTSACRVAAIQVARNALKASVTCSHCGEEFVPRLNTQALCSERCRNAVYAARVKERKAGGEYTPRTLKRPRRPCPTCGQVFRPESVEQEHCSERCEQLHTDLLRSLNATFPDHELLAMADGDPDFDGPSRTCLACGVRQASHNYPSGFDVCFDCIDWEREHRAWLMRCRVCTRPQPDHNRCADCSRRASAARKGALDRAARHGFSVSSELVRPYRVWAVDNYTCHICGLPVVLRGNQGLQPVMDHVRPVINGGPHYYDNIRCSHHYCNAVKTDDLKSPDTRRAVIRLIERVYSRRRRGGAEEAI